MDREFFSEKERVASRCTSERGETLFSDNELRLIADDISKRIIEAFEYLPLSEITFLLRTNSATVRSFIEGGKMPSVEVLLGINRITGVSIDWILTGKGEKHPSLVEVFNSLEGTALVKS
jgi:hypothetical protein